MATCDILESMTGGPPRLTELGKIKCGGLGDERQSQSGGTYRLPVKHDYFTVTTMHRTPKGDLVPDAALMEQLIAKYGDPDKKLRQLPVRVLSDDIEDVLQTAYVWYGGKTVGGRSDGKEVEWFNDAKSGKRLDAPRKEAWKPEFLELKDSRGNRLFKLHSVFNCVVAAQEARWGGVYKFRTTSVVSFKQLYACLLHISQLTGGVLIGMPIMLVIRPIQVAPDGKPTTVYVVHAELRGPDMMSLQKAALQQASWALENRKRLTVVQQEYRKLLLPPGQEGAGDSADIAAEFQPETQELEPAPPQYDIIDAPDTLDIGMDQREPESGGEPPAPAPTPPATNGTKAACAPGKAGCSMDPADHSGGICANHAAKGEPAGGKKGKGKTLMQEPLPIG